MKLYCDSACVERFNKFFKMEIFMCSTVSGNAFLMLNDVFNELLNGDVNP